MGSLLVRIIICFAVVFVGLMQCANASDLGANYRIIINPSSPVVYEIKRNVNGESEVLFEQNGKVVSTLDKGTIAALSDQLINIAKQVCTLKVRPDSVTVSLPVLSATWNTKRLCG